MPWRTSSDLKDDFNFRVDTAVFEINDALGGNLTLNLTGTDLDSNELTTLLYTCGPGWYSEDGAVALHATKKEFSGSTKIGRLITRVVDILTPDVADALGEPTEARTWVDLVFHIVNEERPYTFQGTSSTTTDRLPTEVWPNEATYRQNGSASATVTGGGSTKAEQIKARLARTPGNVQTLDERLSVLAKTSDTFESFVNSALEIDEVVADDSLVERVADETNKGFYATHH